MSIAHIVQIQGNSFQYIFNPKISFFYSRELFVISKALIKWVSAIVHFLISLFRSK